MEPSLTHHGGVILQDWAVSNEPDPEKLNYAGAYWPQVMFVRDNLWSLFYSRREASQVGGFMVVGQHASKSVLLPVFSILARNGLEIRLRNNFHDWSISVKSTDPVPDNFGKLFEKKDGSAMASIGFEGFHSDWRFGTYAVDQAQFSLFLYNDYDVYTFMYLLAESFRLGVRNNR